MLIKKKTCSLLAGTKYKDVPVTVCKENFAMLDFLEFPYLGYISGHSHVYFYMMFLTIWLNIGKNKYWEVHRQCQSDERNKKVT